MICMAILWSRQVCTYWYILIHIDTYWYILIDIDTFFVCSIEVLFYICTFHGSTETSKMTWCFGHRIPSDSHGIPMATKKPSPSRQAHMDSKCFSQPTSWASSDSTNFKIFQDSIKTPFRPDNFSKSVAPIFWGIQHVHICSILKPPKNLLSTRHHTTSSPMAPPMPWSARSRVECRMAFDIFPRCLGLGGWDDIPMESSHS